MANSKSNLSLKGECFNFFVGDGEGGSFGTFIKVIFGSLPSNLTTKKFLIKQYFHVYCWLDKAVLR